MSDQYLRKVGLVVTSGSKGLDLSALRIQFRTTAMDVDAPPAAYIRVFNLSDDTAQQVQNEYQNVMLQAGYQTGNFGIIHQGTIKQIRRGRLNATDKYLDIFSADLDTAYNFGVVNKSLKAGASSKDQIYAIVGDAAKQGMQQGNIPNSLGTGGTLPRGKVLFGLARERLTDVANTTNTSWSITNGKVNFIEETGYLPDEAVVLNAQTGMVLVPEADLNGINVTCLLNPNVKIGTRVQIDNASINQTTVKQQGFPNFTDLTFPASVTADGMYRSLVIQHIGDTRGNEWYSKLICLSLDSSAPAGNSVAGGV